VSLFYFRIAFVEGVGSIMIDIDTLSQLSVNISIPLPLEKMTRVGEDEKKSRTDGGEQGHVVIPKGYNYIVLISPRAPKRCHILIEKSKTCIEK
jgi:hypothetical protein